MTTTTEKIIDLLETDNDKELIQDVETLEKMGYAKEVIQALLIMVITQKCQSKLLENELGIAELEIERLQKGNEVIAESLSKALKML